MVGVVHSAVLTTLSPCPQKVTPPASFSARRSAIVALSNSTVGARPQGPRPLQFAQALTGCAAPEQDTKRPVQPHRGPKRAGPCWSLQLSDAPRHVQTEALERRNQDTPLTVFPFPFLRLPFLFPIIPEDQKT